MPAILRKSLPNNYALITESTPYAFYDVVGVRRAGSATVSQGARGMWICNTMPWGRCVYAGVAVAFGPALTSILSNSAWFVWFDPGGW